MNAHLLFTCKFWPSLLPFVHLKNPGQSVLDCQLLVLTLMNDIVLSGGAYSLAIDLFCSFRAEGGPYPCHHR